MGNGPFRDNMILCRSCYSREIEWRRFRNKSLNEDARYDLPAWKDLQPYPET